MLNYQAIRPFVFKMNPETAHSIVEFMTKVAPKIPMLLPFLSCKNCIKYYNLSQEID